MYSLEMCTSSLKAIIYQDKIFVNGTFVNGDQDIISIA